MAVVEVVFVVLVHSNVGMEVVAVVEPQANV